MLHFFCLYHQCQKLLLPFWRVFLAWFVLGLATVWDVRSPNFEHGQFRRMQSARDLSYALTNLGLLLVPSNNLTHKLHTKIYLLLIHNLWDYPILSVLLELMSVLNLTPTHLVMAN